jgi:hypothetical protein
MYRRNDLDNLTKDSENKNAKKGSINHDYRRSFFVKYGVQRSELTVSSYILYIGP